MRAILLVLVANLLYGQCHGDSEIQTRPTADTRTTYIGTLSEHEFDLNKYTTAKFLGIPFALPPERFARPVLDTPKDGVFRATKFGNICTQDITISNGSDQHMSEDCLYLNVYVPVSVNKSENNPEGNHTVNDNNLTTTTFSTSFRTSSTSISTGTSNISTEVRNLPAPDTTYAVLIYIHGGSFLYGSGNDYDGFLLAGHGNIIVVTINYRLGNFGFLSTNDDVIPGNLGLWDQHVAIQWVNKYIHVFGGDPGRITVGGQSAGSYSTIYQGLYQGNNGLFQRMIAQSGTPTAAKSASKVGYMATLEVAKRANCAITGSKNEIKACLMKKSAQELVKINLPMLVPASLTIQPTLDNPFVVEDPYLVMSQMVTPLASKKSVVPPHFISKDLLIGTDAQDGDVVFTLFAALNAGSNIAGLRQLASTFMNEDVFKMLINSYFQNDYKDIVDECIIEAVLQNYIDWEQPEDNISLTTRTLDLFTDITFALPSLDTAAAHIYAHEYNETGQGSKNSSGTETIQNGMKGQGTTFVYRFTLPRPEPCSFLPILNGTGHASELKYVFGGPQKLNNEDEISLAKAVMTYWSNFVKSGDPNKDSSSSATPPEDQQSQSPLWKAYSLKDEHFLELTTNPVSKSRMRANFRHFWTQFLPKLKYRLQTSNNNNGNNQQEPNVKNSNGQDNLRVNYFVYIVALCGLIVSFPLIL